MMTAQVILGGEVVRSVKEADAARITEIYNHYILNTLITFEEQPPQPGGNSCADQEHHKRVSVVGV
jgi:L-amino acid N-acyltransferase YncA